jgi:hypothetical protein
MPTRAKQVIDTVKLAWAAGFTDGEGYIGLTRCLDKKRGYYTYRVQIEVAQVHEAPIRLLHSMFHGVGKGRHYTNTHRGYWTWRVFGQDALRVISLLLPYLVVKQAQARLVLEYGFTTRVKSTKGTWKSVPVDLREKRAALWAALCELNGGRAVQAERLNKEAPTLNREGDAIVRSHGNINHESTAEMTVPQTIQ